ncbi:MAG: ABC transporter permease, partial [Gaiellaceae bacterium]
MSALDPSIALLDLLERRVRHRNNAFRRRGSLLVGAALLLAVIVVTLAAPLITSYDPNQIDPLHPLAAPLAAGHFLGTDAFGRDILSRILYGGR